MNVGPGANFEPLLKQRNRLLALVRRKVADPDLAEDILQDSLLKAIRSASELRSEELLVPWFKRILTNAVIDHYRTDARKRAAAGTPVKFHEDFIVDEGNDDHELCECFRELLPSLKPEYAELINRLDLEQEPADQVAARLGITANNLKVRHHRARQSLRTRLEESCRLCAKHGCLDCTCTTGR